MNKPVREVETLATFVHGVLSAFHFLGAVFNIRRGNKLDAAIHTVAFCYDLKCAHKHYRAVKG